MNGETQRVDLVAFLLARIAEDEAVARAAVGEGSGSWEARPYWFTESHEADVPGVTYDEIDLDHAMQIARWDPARVLAECEAKRRIITTIQRWLDVGYPTLDHVLFALALPYADHPDYDESWRP